MNFFIKVIFFISLCIIFYTYIGYPFVLRILLLIKSKYIDNQKEKIINQNLSVSIIIAAYNEEKAIKKRIENLLEQNYPKDKLEIIVAADGSMDRTVEIAKKFEKYGVRVLDFKQNRGRAAVHNDAVKVAKGKILIFTDAETEFEKNFVKSIVKYFSKSIGCVVGNLIYKSKKTSISQSEGLYFKFEKKIRELESKLGILATATGACMAIRKEFWKDLTPIDDIDFTTPLDVILQGYKVVFAKDAIAYDIPPSSIRGELKVRIRQTSKNLVGTLKRWGIKGWIEHPFVSWGLLSHKILRWFTPFFMVGVFVSNIFLLNKNLIYKFTFGSQIAFYIIAILGFIGELSKKRIPVASTIFSFCIACIGMGIGVMKGLLGKAPATYKKEE